MFSGFLSIDKPAGITSHTVVSRVRHWTGVKRVGHAGTLDPFATGVLVVAVGRENTKQLSLVVDQDKEYLATVMLGATSSTDDPEGIVEVRTVKDIPTLQHIEEILPKFIGQIWQTPPIYSAIKVQGMPAHRRVRKGQDVQLAARQVLIHAVELVEYSWPLLKLRVHCGKGVYIRALARDIGELLQTGAYVTALDRTRVGAYTKQESLSLEQVEKLLFKNK
jgi:tRNA pseudouridine55 synthase